MFCLWCRGEVDDDHDVEDCRVEIQDQVDEERHAQALQVMQSREPLAADVQALVDYEAEQRAE